MSELTPSEYYLPIDRVQNLPMTVTVSINGAPIKMEVDTGAMLSIMSYSTFLATWSKRHQPELKSLKAKLRTYTGEEIAVTGCLT